LFQLLKYFPGRLEVIGAIVIPGIAVLGLAALPWLDRGRSREWRNRRLVLSLFVAGLAGVVTLTSLGALDRPAASSGWNVRELAGSVLMASSDRCAKCHRADGPAAPIEGGRVSRPADWLAMHVADPEVIAAGLREPPPTNERENLAILAALARLRNGPLPMLDPDAGLAVVIINSSCLGCHTIDGLGGKDGPDLSRVGQHADAASLERRIFNPVDVKPDAEMPPFGGRLKPEEIRAVANWLAARK
jgi:mono/diheme cytochrome c family protein